MSDVYCKIVGKVRHIGPVEEVGPKGFKKRLLVVETLDRYPVVLATEWSRDRLNEPDDVAGLGDVVKIEARVDGREYNGRWYVSLIGQKVESVTEPTARTPPPADTDRPSARTDGPQDQLPF